MMIRGWRVATSTRADDRSTTCHVTHALAAAWAPPWWRGSLSCSPPARRRHQQPQRRDDEGWEHRRSRSPVGRTRCQGFSPVRSHGAQKVRGHVTPVGGQVTLQDAFHANTSSPRAVPATRCFHDPSLSFLPRLCGVDMQDCSCLSWLAADPMVMELLHGLENPFKCQFPANLNMAHDPYTSVASVMSAEHYNISFRRALVDDKLRE
jgi:hypothetical protein